jgi:hypothetical protein
MLEREGWNVQTLDISEFLKAEAGLTCMSLVFETGIQDSGKAADKPCEDRL